MTALILQANTRALPLPSGSVDLIVTSPPYFALRSYEDDGEHYAGQIGSETSPAEYLDALWQCTREWIRVLKPSGSIFVNLGDKYGGSGGGGRGSSDGETRRGSRLQRSSSWGPEKSLLGLPWRYAIGCTDHLGLINRAEIIWEKPNGLPESVTDRVRRTHEQWFHFTKHPKYFAGIDEIRVPHTGNAHAGRKDKGMSPTMTALAATGYHGERPSSCDPDLFNPLGARPTSVWDIQAEPLNVPAELGVKHFAAFPSEWPRRLILGWSPAGICVVCGEGRQPVLHQPGLIVGDNNPYSRDGTRTRSDIDGGQVLWDQRMANPDQIIGYACACTPRTSNRGNRGNWREGREVMPTHGSDDFTGNGNAVPRRPGGFGTRVPPPEIPLIEYHLAGWTPPATRPSIVLDPFGGTGTTAAVASALGRIGISVDGSHDYCRLARWRAADPDLRAKVRRERKPVRQAEGQEALFA